MNKIFPSKSGVPLQGAPAREESSGRASALKRFRVLVAGLCALVLSVGLARFCRWYGGELSVLQGHSLDCPRQFRG